MRVVLRVVTAALTLALSVTFVLPVSSVTSAQRAAAAPATLPLTLTNDAGVADPMYVTVLGTDLATGQLGYVDPDGAFHAWRLPSGDVPVAAPDVSMAGPEAGQSLTLALPHGISGRVYYSYGSPVGFRLVSGGLVQPAPWNPDDPTAGLLFDWVEFTYDGGLWINSTQVDQFALPAAVTTTGADGTARSTGTLVAGGRQAVIDTLSADPDYARAVIRDDDGDVLRVLSPTHAVGAGLVDAGLLDDAIAEAWAAYASATLTVAPFGHSPEVVYTGRTVGDTLVFTDGSGARVAAFERPTTADVLGCDGALHAPNDLVVGPIARTLCAALHRGNLATVAEQPGDDAVADTFYAVAGANRYSGAVHAAMADGRAYGFAFDDVLSQESLVHDPDPAAVALRVQPLDGAAADAQPADPVQDDPAPADPDPAPSEEDTVATTWTAAVVVPPDHPGHADLQLGAGTMPALVTLGVEGGPTSTVAVSGPTTTRIDLAAAAGPARLVLTGSAALGSPRVTLGTVYAFVRAA